MFALWNNLHLLLQLHGNAVYMAHTLLYPLIYLHVAKCCQFYLSQSQKKKLCSGNVKVLIFTGVHFRGRVKIGKFAGVYSILKHIKISRIFDFRENRENKYPAK